MALHATAEAQTVWQWMQDRSLTDNGITVEYSKFLLGAQKYEAAAAAFGAGFGGRTKNYQRTEFIFNGGFEDDPIAGAPFDWTIQPSEHVEIARDGQCLQREERAANYIRRFR